MEATPRRREERRQRLNEALDRPSRAPLPPAAPKPLRLDLPSWTELPARRRRRLVAVLGDLVLRARGEELRDEARRQGEADGDGPAQQ